MMFQKIGLEKTDNLYKGQKQIWFLLKFMGNENDIYLNKFTKTRI